jgi:hypothetical protein
MLFSIKRGFFKKPGSFLRKSLRVKEGVPLRSYPNEKASRKKIFVDGKT